MSKFTDLWNNADKPFFGFFIPGLVAIVGMKYFGFTQWLVTAVPVVLMFMYPFYVYSFRLRKDRIADNLYYLGFLYTLTSMAYSLYSYSYDQGGSGVPEIISNSYDQGGSGVPEIISNFGIALATTIVGLALRVLFSPLQEDEDSEKDKDPVEYEREVRHELIEAARHLKIELHGSVSEFSGFRENLQQSMQEHLVGMLASTKNVLDEHGRQYIQATSGFSAELAKATAESSEFRQTLQQSMEEHLSGMLASTKNVLDEHGRQYIQATSGFSAELAKATAEFGGFRENLQQSMQEHLFDMLAGTKNVLDVHSQQYIQVTSNFSAEFIKATSGFTEAAAQVSFNTAGVAAALAALVKRIDNVDAPSDLVTRKIEPAVTAITSLVGIVQAHTERETLYFNHLHALLEQVLKSHHQLEQVFNKQSDAYGQQTMTLQQETARMQIAVASLEQLATNANASVMRQFDVQTQQVEQFGLAVAEMIEQHRRALATEVQEIHEHFRKSSQDDTARQAALKLELEQLRHAVTTWKQAQALLGQLNKVVAEQMGVLKQLTSNYAEVNTTVVSELQTLKQRVDTLQENQTSKGWFRWLGPKHE